MGQAISTAAVKGTRDFFPEDMRLRNWLFDHFKAVAAEFGFEEYDSCVLESEELYVRKAGDEITGQLYNFLDKGDRKVALRPEMTPSLARMVMAKGGSLALPARWFAIPQCFRYERMQKGRKREHFQWNMDIVGLDHIAGEVELMTAQVALLKRLGFDVANDIVFKVSHRQVLQHFLEELGISGEGFAAVCVIIDKHDKIGREACGELLAEQGVTAEVATKVLDFLNVRGIDDLRTFAGTDNPGVEQLDELMTLATAAGIGNNITIDCSVVRGLSYYTGTVWELFAAAGDLQRAIAGGGRYDRLIDTFGGTSTPMVGFGFGDVVIMELCKAKGLLPKLDQGVDDVVFPMKSEQFPAAAALATRLRAEGRRVLVDYSQRRFKNVVSRAEQVGAERLCVIGGDEAKRGVYKARSLGDRSEEELPLA